MKTSARLSTISAMFLTALVAASGANGQPFAVSQQARLIELSEILGAVHHLRSLCVANESQTWRQSMIRLIETQDAPSWLADQMIESFNKGYYREQGAYPVCDAASERRAVRLANQGAQLARSIARN